MLHYKKKIDSPDIVKFILFSGAIISMLLAFSFYALQLTRQRNVRIKNLSEELQEQNQHLEQVVSERTEKLATANALLTKNIKELARSNQDLDDFAYVASHDLKAPLRGIDQLVSWIAEDIEAQNLQDIPKNIALTRSRVQRLEYLLSDLLEYSRANRTSHKVTKVNCEYLFNETFALISPPKSFTLTIEDEIPEFFTRVPPLEQVVRNLLNNAIKHHDKETGHIKIGFTETKAYYCFSISDDGPGISDKYHEQIFKMFKTLRPRDEVEGSGIGLALIKKIVEYYSGTIKVESKLGHGCTFYFTWPKEFSES